MRQRRRTLAFILAGLAAAGLAAALLLELDGDSSPQPADPVTPDATASATASPAAQPATATATVAPPSPTPSPPAATAVATPTATATPGDRGGGASEGEPAGGRPWRCASAPDRAAQFVAGAEEAMAGYEGVWGLALIDLDCGSPIVVRPQHSQYPASAGKIVILTASLRAVQDGLLEFEAIEEHLELVLHFSLDKNTDEIAALITPEQVGAVMSRAGVAGSSYLEWQWREAWFSPHDLALVWASIVRGEQLDERWTAHLLQLASEVVLPEGRETFPADFGVEGFQYGQKAGYWLPEGDTHHFAAAGYIRPEDGVSAGFAFAFLLESWEEDALEPQRRAVFPLVRDFVVGEVERNR